MTPICYFMEKIWCETDLVFDEFEIGGEKKKKSSYWSKLELRWWNLVVKHFSSVSDMPCSNILGQLHDFVMKQKQQKGGKL